MMRLASVCTALLLALPSAGFAQPGFAQPTVPREDLLALVPPDVGFCVLISDLRGHAQRWGRSPWVQSLRQLPMVRAILDSPETRQITAIEGELKKRLNVDWPTLRDEILGDAVVIAYRPGPPGQPEQEQGMIALRAAKPRLLAALVERVNELQKATGELQELEPLKYHGVTFYRRLQAAKTHYYYLHGPLLVVAGSEPMLRQAIDRDLDPAGHAMPWPARFRRAGSEAALVTLGINPKTINPFPRPAQNEKPQGFAGLWHALDGIFVTVGAEQTFEVRLSLQGRPAEMPSWAQPLFTDTPAPSILWQRFPEPAILTMACRTDFAGLVRSVLDSLPPAERGKLSDNVQGGLKLITRLDLLRDVVPNLGPDWGVCVLPAADGMALPQVIAALAVQPGDGPEPVDEMLFKGAQLFAGFAVLEHNRKFPADPIKVESQQNGKVTIKVLTSAKAFPAGIRPACAIKDGFLLLASAPDAIARFGPREAIATKNETPLLRVSPPELAQLLRLRREQVVNDIRQKHQLSAPEAERNLDHLLGLLDLFEAIALTQRTEPGQASWTLRMLPRHK
jgi:hypothetical protein